MSDDTTHSTVTRRRALAAGAGLAGFAVTASAEDHETRTVRIENVSNGSTLDTTDGSKPVPISPGAFAVHSRDEPIWSNGELERDNGLEEIAEDGMPGRLADSLRSRGAVDQAGAFATPTGDTEPGPLLPGDAYEFEIEVSTGLLSTQSLSLVTMFIQSTDLFFGLGGPAGLDLRQQGTPVTGDVTDAVGLYDAGTEINQEPGVGENQAPRQRATNIGDVERGTVVPIKTINGYDYPSVGDVIRVTLS